MRISIHAPTRGATYDAQTGREEITISIHAPTRGATQCAVFHFRPSPDFNPRSHEGSDEMTESWMLRRQYFNPRSHEGSDCNVQQAHQYPSAFQSTLPRGERLHIDLSHLMYANFNPRSHEGSDYVLFIPFAYLYISIHAPTRGATLRKESWVVMYQFQSTLPRGERHGGKGFARAVRNFNPRSHEGSDLLKRELGYKYDISIHAPTRGATHILFHTLCCDIISIHAPTRGATNRKDRIDEALLNFNPRSHEGSDGWCIRLF